MLANTCLETRVGFIFYCIFFIAILIHFDAQVDDHRRMMCCVHKERCWRYEE